MTKIPLAGCTPEPLMCYLKALGILRLVSEQKDPEARGWWKNDVFWLRSLLNHEDLVQFFLQEYRPTPIVAPWAGGSGFFSGDNANAVNSLCSSNADRCASVSVRPTPFSSFGHLASCLPTMRDGSNVRRG